MPEPPQPTRIRLLLAAIVIASTLGLILSAVYATDAALSIIERLQRLPLWLGVMTASLVAAVIGASGWLLWRLLHPRRSQPALSRAIDRASVEARLAKASAQTAPLQAELLELDRRAALQDVQLALFGDVSTGKSSLIRALVPGAEVQIDVRAGTTRCVQHYPGRLSADLSLVLADVPGTAEWLGAERAVAAREEALRAHVVAYVCDGDLTRTQFEEISWLREFSKPLLLILNKTDRYSKSDLAAITTRLRERTGLKPILVSAGGVEILQRVDAHGEQQRVERERPPSLQPLIEALTVIARRGPAAYEADREHAVLAGLDLKLGELEASERARKAGALVQEYARKAAIGAMAAVAPGTDLVIQGVLATRLLAELTALYQVPLRSIDLDGFVELAGGRLRGSTALILAIVGNALKAFPGLGTVGGGLVHAVAYAMIFDSLGRAVADTLAHGEGFDKRAALQRFDARLADRGGLLDLAPQMLKLAIDARAAAQPQTHDAHK